MICSYLRFINFTITSDWVLANNMQTELITAKGVNYPQTINVNIWCEGKKKKTQPHKGAWGMQIKLPLIDFNFPAYNNFSTNMRRIYDNSLLMCFGTDG